MELPTAFRVIRWILSAYSVKKDIMKTMQSVLVSYNLQYTSVNYKNHTEEKSEEEDDISAGAIFGIVLVCIAGLLILILIIVAIIVGLRRQRRNKKPDG